MKLNTETFRHNKESKYPPIVFLHGFTGSAEDWRDISAGIDPDFTVYAVDLPGHGRSPSPKNVSHYSHTEVIKSLRKSVKELETGRIILCGYSMGGRAALSLTLSHPELTDSLILESTSAGIKEYDDRNNRVLTDNKIASLILSGTIDNFTDYWMNIPLFETQKSLPREKLAALRINKMNNNRTGLANSLLGFGTGKMPAMWDDLDKIQCPVLLITGQYDEKFTFINAEIAARINNSAHHIVQECGHNVHLEKPEHFLNLINNFLYQNYKFSED